MYFNWRLITLQYCIGFAIHQHVFFNLFFKLFVSVASILIQLKLNIKEEETINSF